MILGLLADICLLHWDSIFFNEQLSRSTTMSITTMKEVYLAAQAAYGCWKQCIPYEGNEDLVGTSKKPKEWWDAQLCRPTIG